MEKREKRGDRAPEEKAEGVGKAGRVGDKGGNILQTACIEVKRDKK